MSSIKVPMNTLYKVLIIGVDPDKVDLEEHQEFVERITSILQEFRFNKIAVVPGVSGIHMIEQEVDNA